MVALLVVGVVANGHEVQQLGGVPVREEVRVQTNKVSTDEDVEDGSYERSLLARGDGQRLVEARVQAVDRLAHALPIALELLAFSRDPPSPLINNSVSCYASVFRLVLQLFRLRGQSGLQLVKALCQGHVLDKIEHGQSLHRWEESGLVFAVIVVRAVGDGVGA